MNDVVILVKMAGHVMRMVDEYANDDEMEAAIAKLAEKGSIDNSVLGEYYLIPAKKFKIERR